MQEDFDPPLVIGYLGFDVAIFEGGQIGPPIPTHARTKVDIRSESPAKLDEIAALLTTTVERALETENDRATGAKVTVMQNASPSHQHSLLMDNEHAVAVAKFLRDDATLRLDFCSNVTGVDWLERTIKNTTGGKLDVVLSGSAPAGSRIQVSPSKLKLNGGASATFSVTISSDAALDTQQVGEVALAVKGGPTLHLPVAQPDAATDAAAVDSPSETPRAATP